MFSIQIIMLSNIAHSVYNRSRYKSSKIRCHKLQRCNDAFVCKRILILPRADGLLVSYLIYIREAGWLPLFNEHMWLQTLLCIQDICRTSQNFWLTSRIQGTLHHTVPQISGCWLFCLFCSRQSWAVDPLWPGTQRTPLLPERLSGLLGFVWILGVLHGEMQVKSQAVTTVKTKTFSFKTCQWPFTHMFAVWTSYKVMVCYSCGCVTYWRTMCSRCTCVCAAWRKHKSRSNTVIQYIAEHCGWFCGFYVSSRAVVRACLCVPFFSRAQVQVPLNVPVPPKKLNISVP